MRAPPFELPMPPTRPPLEFARLRILVDDFARSWTFYRDVLGLTPVKGHGEPPYGEFVSGAGAMVSLFDRRRMADALGPAGPAIDVPVSDRSLLVFETPDVDEFYRRLVADRVPIVAGPTDRPDWQLRTLHLRDPDGYLIEIYSGLSSVPSPRSSGG